MREYLANFGSYIWKLRSSKTLISTSSIFNCLKWSSFCPWDARSQNSSNFFDEKFAESSEKKFRWYAFQMKAQKKVSYTIELWRKNYEFRSNSTHWVKIHFNFVIINSANNQLRRSCCWSVKIALLPTSYNQSNYFFFFTVFFPLKQIHKYILLRFNEIPNLPLAYHSYAKIFCSLFSKWVLPEYSGRFSELSFYERYTPSQKCVLYMAGGCV